MSKNPKLSDQSLSDNERLKSDSDYLRGTIKDDLGDSLSSGFRGDNFQLIRFHGMYEQDNRDLRPERVARKLEPLKNVMLRCRLPGGIISPKQWLGIDEFASKHTEYGSIRLTNRQTFQFHGVLKENIKPMQQWLNQLQLDSLATAGDVNRNVLCTSNPVESTVHEQAYEWAKKISEHLLPKTHAYAEIWLDGEKQHSTEDKKGDEEPILGKSYLPRKFKTTVVVPPHNDVDVHANDLNFVAIAKGEGKQTKLVGFNVLVGGGLSMTHGDPETYPSTAYDFGFIALDKVLDCATAVVTTQRDWGNRSNRKNAKTRYTLRRVGVEVFKAEVEKRMQATFSPSHHYEFTHRGDNIGWTQGTDGRWHLTLFIENGRLLGQRKAGIAKIAKIHHSDFRLTANQNLIVAGVATSNKTAIEKIAREHDLISDDNTPLRRSSMACVSFPTCPLAMAEAERFLPQLIDKVDKMMDKHGVADEGIILRIAGCPNGCGRAMLAEIGLIGKALGRYNLYLGGNQAGTLIPRHYRENISVTEILSILDEFIGQWAKNRQNGEAFGDYIIRSVSASDFI
ncbi:MAG: assimilatory sulfite reductase (NADPH) hemoprotein subunit [Ostreibacterium sp.]